MEQIVRTLSNQEAYLGLSNAGVHWDRKDAQHIIVWTLGYKTAECHDIERYLMQAGMICVDQDFDKHCGKTYSIYKHKRK